MQIKSIISVSLVSILLASCGTGTETVAGKEAVIPETDTAEKISINNLPGCYLMNIGKDTARLKLNITGNEVSGTLSYKRFEKDSNDGTIDGVATNDKIKVWYRFQSEGAISVREVYFRIIADKLAEGYGEMEQRNDTAYFRFPTALRYEELHPYLKIDCE